MATPRYTVTKALENAATNWPDQVAVIDEESALTYAQLREASLREAQELRAAGLVPGDRVLIMLPTSIRYVTVWLGCMAAGLVEVPVNTDYTGEMLRHIVRDSRARAMITTVEFMQRLQGVPESSNLEITLVVDGVVRTSARELAAPALTGSAEGLQPAHALESDSPIGVLYTSGTTGPSKGAVISHHQAYLYADRVARLLELRMGDVYYGPLPLFHIAGQWAVVYACILVGATAQIRGRFSLSEFWSDCARTNANVTYLLGSMAQLVSRHTDDPVPEHNLDRMLMVPLVPDIEAFRRRFGLAVVTCYGSTEAGVPLAADFNVSDPTVVGTPVDGYLLRIVDDCDVDVADGVVGELLVRTDGGVPMFSGYFGNPDATAKAVVDGWFHTGDLLRRDAQGNYHFVDRSKDALRRRGENISSFEVEREVYAHPLVQECAAVGITSDLTEDDLVVFVVAANSGADFEAELAQFLRKHSPKFMWPDRIFVVDEIPKTPTGKTAKQQLRDSIQPSAAQ